MRLTPSFMVAADKRRDRADERRTAYELKWAAAENQDMQVNALRRGFTLIELMVVVVIVGILAAVAFPAYTSHVQRSRRADAVALLSAVVQAQERYRANQAAYADTLTALGISAATIASHYGVTITGVGNPASLATGYIATAAVLNTSPQKYDNRCASLGVQVDGASLTYIASDSGGNPNSSHCWPR